MMGRSTMSDVSSYMLEVCVMSIGNGCCMCIGIGFCGLLIREVVALFAVERVRTCLAVWGGLVWIVCQASFDLV